MKVGYFCDGEYENQRRLLNIDRLTAQAGRVLLDCHGAMARVKVMGETNSTKDRDI
jgi:hypothetical protein